MTPKVLEAINRQIAAEFSASFSYLSMAAWCEHHNFTGAGSWLRLQSAEEHAHGLRLFDFVLARNHPARLSAMPQPETDFDSIVDVFERARDQEQEVSRQIDALYELAFQEKVFAAMAELQWFITEQVEEEKTSSEIVETLKMIDKNASGLYMFDRELGQRGPAD